MFETTEKNEEFFPYVLTYPLLHWFQAFLVVTTRLHVTSDFRRMLQRQSM